MSALHHRKFPCSRVESSPMCRFVLQFEEEELEEGDEEVSEQLMTNLKVRTSAAHGALCPLGTRGRSR